MKLILIGCLIVTILFALFCYIDNHVDKGELIPTKNPYEKRLKRTILRYIDEIKQLENDFENLAISNGEMTNKLRRKNSTLKFRLNQKIKACKKGNGILMAHLNELKIKYKDRMRKMRNSYRENFSIIVKEMEKKDRIIDKFKIEVMGLKATYSGLKDDFDVVTGKLKSELNKIISLTIGYTLFGHKEFDLQHTYGGVGATLGVDARKVWLKLK